MARRTTSWGWQCLLVGQGESPVAQSQFDLITYIDCPIAALNGSTRGDVFRVAYA